MKSKNTTEATLEELHAKKKTLSILSVILGASIIGYGVYFVVKLASGTWQANNMLAISGMGLLVVAISQIAVRLSAVAAAIKSRNSGR